MMKQVLTIVIVFLASSYSGRAQTSPSAKITPENAFSAIQRLAVETVKSDSAALKKPVFEFDEKEKLLEYYLGGVRVGSFELEQDDPYLVPLEKEIQIEILRDLFKRKASAEEFWIPPLNLAEQLVRDTIRDIETAPDKTVLRERIDHRLELFDATYVFLHQSIRAFAQSKGYTAKKVGDRGLASDSFPVQIVKDPPNGTVRVLPWTKYVLCHDLRKCGDNWPWRELVSEIENMIGEYFYQAEWAGGRKNEGKIDVRNSSPIRFSPRP
jgi:hypothetical protein